MVVCTTSHILRNVAKRDTIKQIDWVTFEKLSLKFYSVKFFFLSNEILFVDVGARKS